MNPFDDIKWKGVPKSDFDWEHEIKVRELRGQELELYRKQYDQMAIKS